MGKTLNQRLVILIMMLSVAGLLASFNVQAIPSEKNIKLNEALGTIDGWRHLQATPLDGNIVTALHLDDYLNSTYVRQNSPVALYVGYYQTPEKIGAAHDPLVCFPGQGWSVDILDDSVLTIKNTATARKVSYASMIVSKGVQKELIVYWFQVDSSTSSDTLGQKLNLLKSRIMRKTGENAFVRVSSKIGNEPIETVRSRILNFIESFYPQFLSFISPTSNDPIQG